MSAAAWIAGEEWTDRPECVCPTLIDLGQFINDGLSSDEDRERLLGPLIFRVLGTNEGPRLTQRRMWVIADVAVREWSPMALRAAGLMGQAAKLASLPPIQCRSSAEAAARAASTANAAANADGAAAAFYAAGTAFYAAATADGAAAATNSTNSANAAANAAARAASAVDHADTAVEHADTAAESLLLSLFIRLIEMGSQQRVEPVRRLSDLVPTRD